MTIRSHLKNKLFVILFLFVIPVQTGIQSYQAFLDARLRGHDSLFRIIIFEMASNEFVACLHIVQRGQAYCRR